MITNADRIITALLSVGVHRLFGMPGGGSNADLIEAAGRAGLPFSLAHTETASAFMATAQAEITSKPGACMATLGPGAASLMNGVANAHLDRVPLIVLTDCQSEAAARVMQHQTLPQERMFSPVVKWSGRFQPDDAEKKLQDALKAVSSLPSGPVHLDVSREFTSSVAPSDAFKLPTETIDSAALGEVPANVSEIIGRSRRPVFLIGLGARTEAISGAIRDLCDRFCIPAFVTYKAKGVIADDHPCFGGILTNGALEREVLNRADAFIAIGLDPVELLPRPWTFPQAVVSVTSWPMKQCQVPIAAELVGDIVSWLQAIGRFAARSEWSSDEILQAARTQRSAMRPCGESGKLLPHQVVELVAEVYKKTRATVDAGAFMFPVMALWPAERPLDVLISNGLATMGFALPAAIGAALLDKSKPIVAFTGDGGLLMCLGELRTAAREGLPLRIIVFDDGDLSLIKVKQVQQKYRPDGVSIGEIDWPALATSLGVVGKKANDERTLRSCLANTVNHPGPVLIDARISPDTYQPTIHALRG